MTPSKQAPLYDAQDDHAAAASNKLIEAFREPSHFLQHFETPGDTSEIAGTVGMTWEETCILIDLSLEMGHLIAKVQEYRRCYPDVPKEGLMQKLTSKAYPLEVLETMMDAYERWRKGVVRGRFLKLAELFQQSSDKAAAMALWFKLSGHGDATMKPPFSVPEISVPERVQTVSDTAASTASSSKTMVKKRGKYLPLPQWPPPTMTHEAFATYKAKVASGTKAQTEPPCVNPHEVSEEAHKPVLNPIVPFTPPEVQETQEGLEKQEAVLLKLCDDTLKAKDTWATMTNLWLRPGLGCLVTRMQSPPELKGKVMPKPSQVPDPPIPKWPLIIGLDPDKI
jgi:hypothetical protein